MKEEEFKKIIQKSSVEISNDFINTMMNSIETNQKRKKALKRLFHRALIIITILSTTLSFTLFQYLKGENSLLNIVTNMPKTPVFVLFMIVILIYLNSFIKVNEENQI